MPEPTVLALPYSTASAVNNYPRGYHGRVAAQYREVRRPPPHGMPTSGPTSLRTRRGGWLPGEDSNLRPAGYKCPGISARLGLSLHPPCCQGRAPGAPEALLGRAPQPLVSARSCVRVAPSAGFAQDYRSDGHRPIGAGSPEFARCFNHGFPWRLQPLQPAALPTELPGSTRVSYWPPPVRVKRLCQPRMGATAQRTRTGQTTVSPPAGRPPRPRAG